MTTSTITATHPIPFVDLVSPHVALEEELVTVFRRALETASFVGGPVLEAFEHEFAEFCGVRDAVGVASGTDALRFALIASGVRPGDTVLTVPNTFVATAEAISQANARPEFIDVDERTYTMNPQKLERYLATRCMRDPATGYAVNMWTGSPVTAVVPVHLYGQMADMDAILHVAASYNLMVIEDACQAHGAEYFSVRQDRWVAPRRSVSTRARISARAEKRAR
jgi:dTDP-4-amino-4,6-dideoxygalactose transaminase